MRFSTLDAARRALNRARMVVLLLLVTNAVYILMFAHLENHSIWDATWWDGVSGYTVGYGDIFPITVTGRSVALTSFFTNFVLFQFLTAHITAEVLIDKHLFSHLEQELLKERAERAERHQCWSAAVQEAVARKQLGDAEYEALLERIGPRPTFKSDDELLEELAQRKELQMQ